MPTETRYWGVIPAAGVGKRMQSVIPKQYLTLAGSTILDLSINRLLSHELISGVVVAVSQGDEWWPDSEYSQHPDVTVVNGGSERCYSVYNALLKLAETVSENDFVLVHDAARPCLTQADVATLINTVRENEDGGILGLPVRDTMKRTDQTAHITHTVEREQLWHAFTPQLFRLDLLINALSRAFDNKQLVTDEASAMELAGFNPVMVSGRADNLKITRPEDLELAEFYLSKL